MGGRLTSDGYGDSFSLWEPSMLRQQFLEGKLALAASVHNVSKANTSLNDWCGGTLLALHRFLTSTPLNSLGRNKKHSLHSLGVVSQGSLRTINV